MLEMLIATEQCASATLKMLILTPTMLLDYLQAAPRKYRRSRCFLAKFYFYWAIKEWGCFSIFFSF
jgi:hypothetical protein